MIFIIMMAISNALALVKITILGILEEVRSKFISHKSAEKAKV